MTKLFNSFYVVVKSFRRETGFVLVYLHELGALLLVYRGLANSPLAWQPKLGNNMQFRL